MTGSKILRIMKGLGLAPEIPEDLYHLIKKAVSMRKHLELFRKDRDGKFRLILVESRIHRLARYYKVRGAHPHGTGLGSAMDTYELAALGVQYRSACMRACMPLQNRCSSHVCLCMVLVYGMHGCWKASLLSLDSGRVYILQWLKISWGRIATCLARQWLSWL